LILSLVNNATTANAVWLNGIETARSLPLPVL